MRSFVLVQHREGRLFRQVPMFFFLHMIRFRFRLKCSNPLSGSILQLDVVTLVSSECVNRKENTCKIQLRNQLKNIFSQLSNIALTIQFDNNRSERINIKLCDLMEPTGMEKIIV